jgi:Ca2+ transporting ATPase
VQLLIGEGEVVAVTGDGTNDVLALKAADVGLAMGIRGTDIAKQASDIVILDDNFKSIVRSVMWGRNVYDNIRKFLQFQLTVNFAALFIVFIGAVADRGAPLKAIQLLWVNLIMDTLAALALGTEKPTGQLLNRKPFGRYDCLLSPHMIRFIIAQGLYQIAVLLVLLFAGNKIEFIGVTCAYQTKPGRFEAPVNGCTAAKIDADGIALQTIIFNAFVYCQVFNEINARRVNGERNVYKGLFSNAMFVGIMLLIGLGQALLVVFTGQFMSVTPFPGINWIQWLVSLVLGAITLPLGFLVSFIPVPKRKPRKKLSEASGCCCIKPVDYNEQKEEEEEEERKRREEMKESHNKALLE